MSTSISTVIISLFIGLIVVKKYNLAFRLKRFFEMPFSKRLRPLDCFPCLSFWTSAVVGLTAGLAWGEITIATMATFVAAYTIEK